MQAVGRGDGDHLKGALFQHLAVIGEDSRNADPFCQRRSIAGSRRGDGKHFRLMRHDLQGRGVNVRLELRADDADLYFAVRHFRLCLKNPIEHCQAGGPATSLDRKSTRLNSSHGYISYAVFCLKKKTKRHTSFASLPEYPELDKPLLVELSPADLLADTRRPSGAGAHRDHRIVCYVAFTRLPIA